MKAIDRRDVLKGLGALSAVAAARRIHGETDTAEKSGAMAAKTGSACVGSQRVNIVLHGMQVLVFDQASKRLLILLPDVPDHAFASGNFGEEVPLGPSSVAAPYTLNASAKGGNVSGPAPGTTANVVIDWNKDITGYGDGPYCAFDLPWPDCLIQLRRYLLKVPLFLPGTTATDNTLAVVTSVPMINVLSYKVSNSNASLAGMKLNFDGSGVAHAHIVAEPAFEMDSAAIHPNKAFSILNVLFDPPLDLRINPLVQGHLPAPVSTEPGVSDLELSTTAELRLKGSGCACVDVPGRGGHPRNCMQLFVIKR